MNRDNCIQNISNAEQRKMYDDYIKQMEEDIDDYWKCGYCNHEYWKCFMLPPTFLTEEDEIAFQKYLEEDFDIEELNKKLYK